MTATGSLVTNLEFHTATLLPNGKVLVAGFGLSELYDPESGTWTASGSLLIDLNAGHTATLLPNGKVLVAGGIYGIQNTPSAGAELYDPASGTWTATGSLITARSDHTATLLPNGKVLVAGGCAHGLVTAELYDPESGTWTAIGSPINARAYHTGRCSPTVTF